MPKRLLLAVADSALAEQTAKGILAPAGYRVSQTHDLNGLRTALREGKFPDLLFLSDTLPGGEAFSIIQEVRETHPTLPVVLITRKPIPEWFLHAIQNGVADVLRLPMEPDAVLAAAGGALDRKRRWEHWLKKETGKLTGPLTRRLSEMEAILRQVNDGVVVLDTQNRVLMINQALRQTFGLGDDDFSGKPIELVFVNPALLEALNDKNADTNRHEVRNPAGRVFYVRVSRVAGMGTVASLHDISYLKELDKLKGDFVNTVSHDLRSPLTAILGYVELIERAGKVNPQQAEFIWRVKNSVHATTNLIDDLLNLGRVEVGSLDELTPVNMKLLVVNAMTSVQPLVQEKGQTLHMGKTGNRRPVLGSRTQLGQLVDNLITNAIKYTQPGGKIRVTLAEKQSQLILRVADNGPGIPLDEQGRIFEKFYRATNVGSGTQGTGLGLAIVKTIVENHRGRIWVDSKPGDGSVFTVVLPVTKEET
ncbi:MAG: hybrid sensor histidine kinase/response regulator [Anaerolineales bacterium]